MPGPIKPSEIVDAKTRVIPDAVFEAFNELIVANWDGDQAVVTLQSAFKAVSAKTGISEHQLSKLGYMDVEDSYRQAGWSVYYTQPAWCETGSSVYIFRQGKERVNQASSPAL